MLNINVKYRLNHQNIKREQGEELYKSTVFFILHKSLDQ